MAPPAAPASATAPERAQSAGPPLPGLGPKRLAAHIRAAIAEIGLDLSGLSVLTEAATGAYVVTPVIAAVAGARRVLAVTRSSRFGTVGEVTRQTLEIAERAGAAGRISVVERLPEGPLDIDVVTNCGHLRPLDADLIERLPGSAVIGLMYEAWEFRPHDLDLAACRRRGIPVVGVNERLPAVDVFSYLGPLAVKLLHDAGIAVYRSRIALLCDNPFAAYIQRGLVGLGAETSVIERIDELPPGHWDAVLVALKPAARPRIDAEGAALIAARAPGALLGQFWGDVDRSAVQAHGIACWPPQPPRPGHMAVLLSDIGPESIVRLQTAGLAAAERVIRHGPETSDPLVQRL